MANKNERIKPRPPTGAEIRYNKFVEYYLRTGDKKQAAIKAGYKPSSASAKGNMLLKNEKVQAKLHARINNQKGQLVANTNEVLAFITSVMRGEQTDEQLMNIGIGEGKTKAEKHEIRVGNKERLKAAEMLAKVYSMFVNKSELNVTGNIPVVIKDDI